jgi:XTP/dITP diphosphohydrolase
VSEPARPVASGRLLLATRSAGKLRELVPLLTSYGWQAITLVEAGIPEAACESDLEIFSTFEDNALAKARYFCALTGGLVVADDSGLEVDALEGRPGVHSKRWSGRPDLDGAALDAENNVHLQRALAAVPDDASARAARYVCAAAAAWPSGECVVRGATAGWIRSFPRGDGGFGYDPYFQSAELGRTFAEVGRDEKAAVSHRGRAFRALLARLDAVRAKGDLDEFALPR